VVFGRRIASLFNADPEVIRLTFWLFVIVASFQILDNFGIILSEAFKGAGMTLFVMLIEVPVNLLFLIIAWFLGVHLDLGVIGAWMGMIVYAIIFALVMIVSFRRGLWQHARA
jgi:Na+-driven multidrug efflux pump